MTDKEVLIKCVSILGLSLIDATFDKLIQEYTEKGFYV